MANAKTFLELDNGKKVEVLITLNLKRCFDCDQIVVAHTKEGDRAEAKFRTNDEFPGAVISAQAKLLEALNSKPKKTYEDHLTSLGYEIIE